MKINYLQTIALFMICLVAAIPICSANAFAAVTPATITAYSENRDGIKDYRAVTDTTTIVAEITEIGVDVNKLKLITPGQLLPFTEQCVFVSGKSICRYYFSSGKEMRMPSGSWPYNVRYEGPPLLQMPADNHIIVDDLPPVITINSLVSTAQLKANYSIQERAYADGGADKCSGIKIINFLLAGQVLKTIELNFEPEENCDYNAEETMDAPSTNGAEKSFCIEAVDNVGNRNEVCQDVLVDREQASASNLKIYGLDDNEIKYASRKIGMPDVVLKFNLDENSLSSITADASDFAELERIKNEQSDIRDVTCDPSTCEGDCECTVPITLHLPDGGNPILKLHVVDMSGIISDLTLPMSLPADNTAPELVSLTTVNDCGSINALGPAKNSLTAVISDAQSGVAKDIVSLDLSNILGSDYTGWTPYECNKAGNEYTCNWGEFGVPSSKQHETLFNIQFVTPSQDVVGNTFSGNADFYYDNKIPKLINYKIIAAYQTGWWPTGDRPEELADYPVGGGTIAIILNITDDFPVSAEADFSDVSMEHKIEQASCSGNECEFLGIGPLYMEKREDAEIPVTITDCVGNVNDTIVIKIDISVLEKDEKAKSKWDYQVTSRMPDKIDLQTLRTFSHKVFFPMLLSGSNPATTTPIVQELVSCEGETGYLAVNMDGDNLPDLMNAPSITPIAKFTLRRGIQPPASLTYNCTIMTVSRTTQGYISQPEFDNVLFTIELYNSPLGTIDDTLRKKADAVKNSALVSGDWIGKLDRAVRYLENICGIYDAIVGVATIFNEVATIIQAIKVTIIGIPAAEAVAKESVIFTDFVHTTLGGKFADKFCKQVGCELTFGGKFGKLQDFTRSIFTDAGTGIAEGKTRDAEGKPLPGKAGLSAKTSGLIKDFSFDPKESLVTSLFTLCVPGILHNLQKARQIDCAYVYCLQTEVPEGKPPFYCTMQRHSQWCRYVWGELFHVLPFVQFAEHILDEARKLIRDPIRIITTVTLHGCIALTEGTAQLICQQAVNVGQIASTTKNLVSYTQNFKNSFTSILQEDMCRRI